MAKTKRDVIGPLTRASRAVRAAGLDELAAIGLHPGQDAVMTAISENEGISLKDLAELLSVKPPTITKTIARLAARGFVEKRTVGGTPRQTVVFLTTEGRMAAKDLKAFRKRFRKTALKGLSDKDRKTLAKLLDTVERNLTQSPEPEKKRSREQ